MAYTHAVHPWPAYIESRCDGRILSRTLKAVIVNQGDMIALGKRDGHEFPTAPSDLIASVATYFSKLPYEESQALKEALWVIRGATSDRAPAPLSVAMICAVIEGLRIGLSKTIQVPDQFRAVQKEASMCAKNRIHSAVDDEEKAAWRRLTSRIDHWPYNDRKVEWGIAFEKLFPGRSEWLYDVFKLFNDNMHGPAHGSFGILSNGPAHSVGDALGRLGGFVNLIIAAMAGYKGPIRETPYAGAMIDLSRNGKSGDG